MEKLDTFVPTKPYIFCIDSDGCVFDTMEIKHKECFCPSYIDHFSLQAISRYARDAWEYTNLYSVSRGMHRFITLLDSLDLLQHRTDVREREFDVPSHEALRHYVQTASALNNDTLRTAIQEHPDAADLRHALDWSLDVNVRIGEMVHGIPPFPYVREQLNAMISNSNIIIVSATQEKALEREWDEHGLLSKVNVLCGQETGSKSAVIAKLRHIKPDATIVMIGDAPGDRKAAEDNAAYFYPICPSNEATSWNSLSKFLPQIFNGTYHEQSESQLNEAFTACLPTKPNWKSY